MGPRFGGSVTNEVMGCRVGGVSAGRPKSKNKPFPPMKPRSVTPPVFVKGNLAVQAGAEMNSFRAPRRRVATATPRLSVPQDCALVVAGQREVRYLIAGPRAG